MRRWGSGVAGRRESQGQLKSANAKHMRSNLSRIVASLLGFGAIALGPFETIASSATDPTSPSNPPPNPPQIAQRIRVRDVWPQVYEQLPNLPIENEYIEIETGEVDPDDTLISRLIRYHVYVKGRPPQYRLDWKLTLADYLGANDLMFEGVYPGGNKFDRNPLYGDREAIAHLSRAERNALVHTLTSLFNPQYLPLLEAAAQPEEPPATIDRPTQNDRTPPRQPQPGDVELLLP